MIRQIATLLSGNALSQLINVATVLFVVSAYFGPDEFGRYAVVMSYVGILASVACLRYDIAIVAVPSHRSANNVMFGSLIVAATFSVIVLVVLWVLARFTGGAFLLGISPIVVALLVFLLAVIHVFSSVLYRHERYMDYSILKLLQAVTLFGGFLIAGINALGTTGLVYSTLAAYVVFVAIAVIVLQRHSLRAGVRLSRVKSTLRKNSDFVKFNTPQSFFDNILSNGLNLIVMALAGATVVGYFNFMHRILKAPLGLIFGAMSQVVYRFCAKHATQSDLVHAKLRQVLSIDIGVLLLAAIATVAAYFLVSEVAFMADWVGIRDYMFAFAIWMLVPFLFSPFATLPIVYKRQREFFLIATTFNLATLLVLAVMIWAISVNVAFLAVGLASSFYFAGMTAWAFKLIDSEKQI